MLPEETYCKECKCSCGCHPCEHTKGFSKKRLEKMKNEYDEWIKVTGIVAPHSSYYGEIWAQIEDAFQAGRLSFAEELEKSLPEEAIEDWDPMQTCTEAIGFNKFRSLVLEKIKELKNET